MNPDRKTSHAGATALFALAVAVVASVAQVQAEGLEGAVRFSAVQEGASAIKLNVADTVPVQPQLAADRAADASNVAAERRMRDGNVAAEGSTSEGF